MSDTLPVVVIGAGPVGLAAAVHLRARGLKPLVLEAGTGVGAAMRHWSHIRMFSPWHYNVDALAAGLLSAHGWTPPDPERFPTGGELVASYLEPLAATPELSPHILTDSRVVAVTRLRHDRMKDAGREQAPFLVRYLRAGEENEVLARAVIDASGTFATPNPIGAGGIPALGERAAADAIVYGMPDVLGTARSQWTGKRVLVVGSGHSAFNVLVDLARLRAEGGAVSIHWAVRRTTLARVLGGGENDKLAERGRLGMRIAALVADGAITLHTGVLIDRVSRSDEGLVVHDGTRALPPVDRIVGATGFRPDLRLLDELRLDLDAGVQAPSALAPLIDPNLHSCGTVRPHGAEELRHPDAGVWIVGMKSYGRAPTFLLLTGYEQVRSVVAAIAGDWEAARRVELVLPETGVCSTQFADEDEDAGSCCAPAAVPAAAALSATEARGSCSGGSGGAGSGSCGSKPIQAAAPKPAAAGCCGGPAPDAAACCVRDAEAKAAGESGCGCSTPAALDRAA